MLSLLKVWDHKRESIARGYGIELGFNKVAVQPCINTV